MKVDSINFNVKLQAAVFPTWSVYEHRIKNLKNATVMVAFDFSLIRQSSKPEFTPLDIFRFRIINLSPPPNFKFHLMTESLQVDQLTMSMYML